MTTQRRSRFIRGLFSYAQLFIISRAGYQMVYALLRERNHRGYRLGQSARASVVREHTWDAVARRILGLAGLKPEPKSQPRTVESII